MHGMILNCQDDISTESDSDLKYQGKKIQTLRIEFIE